MGQAIFLRPPASSPASFAPPLVGELSSAERETEGGVHCGDNALLRLLALSREFATSPVNGGGFADEDAGGPRGGPRAKNLEALVGAAGWARLPQAVVARFGGAAMEAAFAGEGRFEASWIGQAFAMLGVLFGRPLPLRAGAARVFICVAPSTAGEVWTRIYCFGGGEEIVRSVKHAGRGAWLEERAGLLIMRLKVFEERGALVFECIDFLLRVGPVEIPVPIELTPGRIRVEHHDYGAGRFAFALEARHPWFGVTFRQTCELHDVGARA